MVAFENSPLDNISPGEFEQQVRDCLSHLYDYSFLRDNRLVQLIVPDITGANQVQVFRQVITEAIERLRPDTGATFHSKQARSYNILMLRYVEQQQPQDVMNQLALSERQFYRDHPKAIQTVAQILWERVTGATMPVIADSTTQTTDISLESEVQRVNNPAEQMRIDLKELLHGAITATQSLANQHDVQVDLRLGDEVPITGVYSGVLRQTVLLLMSRLIVRFESGGTLSVNCELESRLCRIIFELCADDMEAVSAVTAVQESLSQHKSLQTLVDTVDGSLHYAVLTDDIAQVILELPLNQRTVLLVDDNPGMLDLFQRYLAGQPYHVLLAQEGEHAVELARKSQPAVIILDVMLPGKDGWEVLQNLKNHPATRHIPVLICSVLDALELAVSLGADAYIQKPPNQTEFLNALARWQA